MLAMTESAIRRKAFEEAIEMINSIEMWGLSKPQQGAVKLFQKHVSKNLLFMAGVAESEDDEPS